MDNRSPDIENEPTGRRSSSSPDGRFLFAFTFSASQPIQKIMSNSTQTTAPCPECDAPVTREEGVLENEILPCADCGAELEVMALEPFAVALAPEVEEDWGE
ncbi:MAG: alpha-aminoadipate carrier protein LysW [Candidatus Paceibacteria bacterium]